MVKRISSLVSVVAALGLGFTQMAGCGGDDAASDATTGGAAGVAGGGGAAGAAAGDPHPDCDPLVPTACGYPFPSNYFLVDDAKTTTGKRVKFGATTLPKTLGKKHIDPKLFGDPDGFSAAQAPMVHMPGATAAGLPTSDTLPSSIDPASTPSILIEADTGELVPHFAEIDVTPRDEAERALMIRPVVRLKDATRYIVAFRRVKGADGADLPALENFKPLRDGTPSPLAAIEARRGLYDDIFKKLEAKGIARGDLQIAWDYTTASRENNTRAMLKMRDEALATVGDLGPTYTVKKVESKANDPGFPDDRLLARVIVDMDVPLYMKGPEPGEFMSLGDDGLPKQNGTAKAEVIILVPNNLATAEKPVGLLQNGHGLLGSKREGQGGYLATMAHRFNYVAFSVDFWGFASDDVPIVSEALSARPDLWQSICDRQQQGHLNGLMAMRMMKGRIAKEGLKGLDGEQLIAPGVIDPTLSFYRGDSQGGIMGTTYMALSTDVTRGLLGEPGMPYNLLLNRSRDYPAYQLILSGSYPNGLDQQILLGVMQMLWDRSEPNGYAPYITQNMLPNTPEHRVLLHVALGDFQVTTLGAHILARATGAKNLKPVNREVFGVESVDGPIDGSAMVEFEFGLPPDPITNTPPPGKGIDDPHDKVRVLDEAYEQTDEFFRTGKVVAKCDGVCDCGEVLASKNLSDEEKKTCMPK